MASVVTAKKAKTKSPSSSQSTRSVSTGDYSGTGGRTNSSTLSAFYSAGPAIALTAPVQAKFTIGKANDPFEREADSVADRVVSGGPVATITPIPAGGLGSVAQMESEEEPEEATPQKKPIQYMKDEEPEQAPAQAKLIQFMEAEEAEETAAQPKLVQCMSEEQSEETAAQTKLAQQIGEEEKSEGSLPQAKLIQRAEEKEPEKTPLQTKCAECQAEDQVQAKFDFPSIPSLGERPSKAAAEPATEPTPQDKAVPSSGGEAAGKRNGSDSKVSLPAIEPYAPEEKVPPVQTRSLVASNSQITPPPSAQPQNGAGLQETLYSSKGRGIPLPPAVQADMEGRFGRDLSQVRIHTDSVSIQMNRNLRARAFTHKNDIYFNAGEYTPTSPSGRFLLAHELTHTVQQGATGDMVQRFSALEQDVAVEPKPARPDDGGEVTGRMNEKIANDENVQNQDELSEEEREEKKKPDRGEVRQESRAIKNSGEAEPSVDRGAQAEDKTTAQKAQIQQELQEQPVEATEEGKGKGEETKAPLSPAQSAAERAQAAQSRAYAVPIPPEPQSFRHPRIEAPADSAGEPLPRNSQVDTQVRGLGYIGEMLREKGYEMKRHAAQQEMGSHGLDSVLEREREDLARAQVGTAAMQAHNEARQEIAEQSREAHRESVERQEFVASKAPDLAAKADEGGADSGELAAEARSKADQSQSEIPDDEDARADAEQQSSEMQDTAQGAESMDQAIRQTGERARQYGADAEAAAQQNEQSETQITETEDIIAQTGARIEEMQATNEASQAKLDNASPGPARIRQFAQRNAQSGDGLIAATIVLEDELNALQEEYLANMAKVESREEAIKRQQEEQKESEKDELTPEERQLFELAGMSEAEQEQRVAEMGQAQRAGLLATLERMIQTVPDQGTNETEGARLKVDTGLGKAISGEPPPDPRSEEIQEVENRRIERVGGTLDMADRNMNFLTEEQQRMLANKLVAESITDDIKNINVLQMGEAMLKGMIDPRQSLTGVVGGFEKMLTGFANIGNWEAWQQDPLGNLLQIAADITTGLATVFSSILGLAALITAVMVALTIITWGLAAPVTGPVIAWMGTVMTYAGWGALITGGLAVYFNYLSYIKNLHDAGTAETARELFGNTEQMKQNASDGFQGAMAVVEGVGAVKMGPKLSSGEFFSQVPRSPGAFLRQTAGGIKRGAISLAKAPGRIGRGIRELFAGGKQGLIRFKERIQSLFGRRRPGRPGEVDLPDTPQAHQRHQSHLDDARSRRVRDMDADQFGAEMREAGKNRPKRVEPGSEHFDSYDIEVEANGHIYRRRRDGRGWCRFSPGPEECGIPDNALPDQVKKDLPEPASKAKAKPEAADLLDDNQKFKDAELESNYQKYVIRNTKAKKKVRDRLEWLKESEYWQKYSPMARGNKFNKKAVQEEWYDYNEVHLENGKRLDSYDPPNRIVSRKATDLNAIDEGTFNGYLDEIHDKYPRGTVIRSDKYPDIDGQPLKGKYYLEIPESNLKSPKFQHYKMLARKKGIYLIVKPE